MNTSTGRLALGRSLIATAVASVLLAGCAASPVAPEGSAEVRSKLAQLQSDPNLASRAPLAIKEADAAVRIAELPESDQALAGHRVYIADRKVEIARAQAQTRFAEDQRAALTAQRETARLDSRTREADLARSQAVTARSEADAARAATADAEAQAVELQRQIDALQAEVTDRGLVLTLGDVLFATGSAELRAGATSNLDQVVAFLGRYTERTVAIEGHTDSQGSDEYNQGLSQRRADSVRSHLVRQGIDSSRLSTKGAGKSAPIAGNDTAAGRQQNRRVELIISNPKLAAN
jgi:outer membrane protein OmpA-like peptidoglycan-associated protein